MKLCVIDISNPRIKKSKGYVDFQDYSTYEDGKWRSWHSIAACFESEFFIYDHREFPRYFPYDCFLLLVDKEFDEALPLVRKLKAMKKKVAIAYHEGSHLVDNIKNYKDILDLRELVKECDFFWNSNPPVHHLWNFLETRVESISTAVPFDKWAPEITHGLREGIVILTRTLDQRRLKRNTFLAMNIACKVAKQYGTFVSYINEDITDGGVNAQKIVDTFFEGVIRVEERKPKYIDWLRFLSKHKVAIQMDNSNSHGQVISDCALIDLPVFGGNCDNSRLVHVFDKFSAKSGFSAWRHRSTRARAAGRPAVSSDSWEVESEISGLYSSKDVDFSRLKHELSFETIKKRTIEVFNK